MSKITYTDKVTMNENPNVADVNKVKASDMNEIKQVVNENAETLTNLQDQLLDKIYPIGSYYETSNTSFNPNVTWGGTWVEDSKGRVTVALNGSDADFNTISKTGGEKKHQLTVEELPKHSHNPTPSGATTFSQGGSFDAMQGSGNRTYSLLGSSYTGEDVPHNNLQPYIVVVRWHRTA